MSRFRRFLSLLLVLMVGIGTYPMSTVQASSNYVTATKTVNPSSILVGEEAEVTLNIQGTPPVNVVKPNDVILVIDRSGSMGTEKMNNAKAAAKGFIDLMDLSKHRVGVVDYASDAFQGVPLTNDAGTAKSYIDKISAGGGTGTAPAIVKAQELLANHRPDAQPVMVLMTDGDASVGGDGLGAYDYTLKKAEEAKNAGIVFYTIALLDQNSNPDTSGPNKLLKDMATTSHHHHFVLGSTGLSEIYAAIVQEIGLDSAYDVVVKDIVPDNFEIVPGSYDNNIPKPTVSGNTLSWNFLELKKNTLSFTYKIRQKQDGTNGVFPVTNSGSKITYKDYTGANRSYNIPSVNIDIKNPAPIISNVTPNKDIISGGAKIVVEGKNFLPNPKVKIGGAYSTSVNWISSEQLEVIVPAGSQGNVQLTVYNTDNQSATADFAYYANPEISKLDPAFGPMTGGTKVAITGKYFMPGVKVKFGDSYSSNVTYNSSIYLFAQTPVSAQPGTVDVTVENPDGTQIILPSAFTYEVPPKMELTGVAPGEGYTTGNDTVTLTGKLFEKSSKVYFGDVEAQGFVYYSQDKITVKSPVWSQEATVDVKVVNTDGTESVLSQAFKYISPPPPNAPSITSINPSNGPLAGGTVVYIDGKDIVAGAKVLWGNVELNATLVTPTRLKIVTPTWTTPETISVSVVNPDLQIGKMDNAFTYDAPPKLPAPTLKSVSPSNGPLVGKTTIYVDGTNFNANTKLFFIIDGQEVDLNASYVNASRMKASTPAGVAPGAVDLKVLNPDDQSAVMPSAFTYDAPPVYPDPVITSISPNVGNMRGGYVIDIYGTDFQRDAVVMFGSTPLTLAAYMNSSNVRVKVPAAIATGKVDITLTNPDGKTSTLVGGFEYQDDIPTISGISPNVGPMAGGTTVYVDGSYFAQGLIVTMDNVEVGYTYVNSNRVKLTTPPRAIAGTVEVKITNPSGLSASTNYTYEAPPALPAPTITGVSPSSGPVAGGTTIYVDGRNIVSGGMINFNGVLYNSSYVNSTRIKFKVPAAASAGVVTFFIINPDGQQSGTLNFEYK
ncbi:IPT/TIG domain-containing protein [Paenibacillus illinoisensis]|uniref:IPT/TIG domain-containing protein n=1 Tax=Paenibacillus illinoisensis TaxID=59845 RepID=UPI00203B5AB9|nr:IPT/TIG domain-containing protein [Paenibacillus illinoisensis]MCM3208584.1 IPT/TIG domain-containing protein [Paenibacillus illinoisensis]